MENFLCSEYEETNKRFTTELDWKLFKEVFWEFKFFTVKFQKQSPGGFL